jgi:acetyl coenzyme A synthetase (ADP forming)-like protein
MNFSALFYPQSIAVVGASRTPKTVGNDVVKNLLTQGYEGKVYPVNPKADELLGQKVYHSLADIPENIDLVIIAIPAAFVAQAIEEAAAKGAQAAIVISAGFKETGNWELEQQLREVCLKHNIALIGPNCLGVINPEINMNASFACQQPKAGNVAFISQSGALCTAVIDYAKDMGLGFSKFMSIGNKACIDELALIRYFAQDPHTDVIAMYAEQLENAPEFIKVAQELAHSQKPKPIIILKSGRTEAGASAIASHTGSLSGGDAAYEALFAQSGIIRANCIRELFDYAQILARNPLNPGERVAVITNAGGPGVLTTDEIIAHNLKMAELSSETKNKLREFLPPAASVSNPVDVLGDAKADRYEQALQLVLADDNVDSVIILLTPQSMTEIEATASAIIRLRYTTQKPIVVSFMGKETVRPGVDLLRKADVTNTEFPEPAVCALSAFSHFAAWSGRKTEEPLAYGDVDKAKVAQIFATAKAAGQTSFPEAQAVEIMKAYGLPVLESAIARSPEEATQIAERFGGKLAMKIVSPDILHKSDVGGVVLDFTVEEAGEKYESMLKTVAGHLPEAKLEGALLMQMAPKDGIEVILGVNKNPGLGTLLMFGLGGIYVEILKDVSFAFAPVTRADALRMITGLRSSKIFAGARGQAPRDIDALVESIGRLSQLVMDFPEIVELDINPLLSLAQGQGAKVLDARVVIE